MNRGGASAIDNAARAPNAFNFPSDNEAPLRIRDATTRRTRIVDGVSRVTILPVKTPEVAAGPRDSEAACKSLRARGGCPRDALREKRGARPGKAVTLVGLARHSRAPRQPVLRPRSPSGQAGSG